MEIGICFPGRQFQLSMSKMHIIVHTAPLGKAHSPIDSVNLLLLRRYCSTNRRAGVMQAALISLFWAKVESLRIQHVNNGMGTALPHKMTTKIHTVRLQNAAITSLFSIHPRLFSSLPPLPIIFTVSCNLLLQGEHIADIITCPSRLL